MRTIWKTPIVVVDEQSVKVPMLARPLTVQMQYGRPHIWWGVDDTAAEEERSVYVRGIGHPLPPERAAYLGSVQEEPGGFVWHVYTTPSIY